MNIGSQKRPLVLVADDDRMMRYSIREAVSAAGYEVVEAADGVEAFEVVDERQPDVVLLDVNMPGLDGYAVCAHLRESKEHQHTPIVMVTGSDDAESVHKAFQVGATDFVVKPINWHLLGHRLHYVMRGANNLKTLKLRDRHISLLAYNDPLTRLPNREYLREYSDELLSTAVGDSAEASLVYLGLDRFRQINDSFGHSMGDEVLSAVALRLQDRLQDLADEYTESCLARVSGDDFVVIVSCKDASATGQAIAKGWLDCLQEPIRLDEQTFYLTANVGIANAPNHGTNLEALLKSAGAAMYKAKELGAGRYAIFSEAIHDEICERNEIETGLREALRSDGFELHYQPKISALDGQMVGAEALLRWEHPTLGRIGPDRFIPVAEEYGLMGEIDRWVATSACRQLADWKTRGLNFPVAINLSGTEFVYGNPSKMLLDLCAHHGISAGKLELEITESALTEDIDLARLSLERLTQSGFRVAVDDFGTGYSSLSYLKGLKIHALKIDHSFVADLNRHTGGEAVCLAVISLAKGLGLVTIAEGVETAHQEDWLITHGCDFLQGFHYSSAMPVEEFEALARRASSRSSISRPFHAVRGPRVY